jgi:NTP pyrophosphatase (non-canonical NTP hydrolase)
MNIRDTQIKIHRTARDKGWYDAGPRNLSEQIMLIVTELAEAVEHSRSMESDLLCDKCNGSGCAKCDFSGDALTGSRIGEELADAIIRTFDLAESLGFDMQEMIRLKMAYNEKRPRKHGKKF